MSAKYPRTPHLPWSPGGTRDDKRLTVLDQLYGRTLVFTEKLDGSNLCLTADAVYARSHSGAPRHPSPCGVKDSMSDEFNSMITELSEETSILSFHFDDEGEPMVLVNVSRMLQMVHGRSSESFDTDPAPWGVVLATALHHTAKAHHQFLVHIHQEMGLEAPPSEEDILARIQNMLFEELQDPKYASAIQGWSQNSQDKH